jgi:hypothetical protein
VNILLLQVKPTPQSLYSTFCVHDALLSRKEGMAFAAYLYTKLCLGGADVICPSAGAANFGFRKVFWMDVCFH